MTKVLFKGNEVTLVGRRLNLGRVIPDFRVISTDLQKTVLPRIPGKVKVITSFPSLDTPVCDLQVKEFNKRAVSLSDDVLVLGISKDLPFAQKRFCEVNNIKNVKTFSDYRFSSFGINYGLLIKELNLLARSVLIADKNNVLRYIQVVPEITDQPDFQEVFTNLEEVLKNPSEDITGKTVKKCQPCQAGIPALPEGKIGSLLARHTGWELKDSRKISKEFDFKDFTEAVYFVDLISIVAEEQGHHPNITILYNKVRITLTTHAVGGLTENDFIMAGIIDKLT